MTYEIGVVKRRFMLKWPTEAKHESTRTYEEDFYRFSPRSLCHFYEVIEDQKNVTTVKSETLARS